MVGVGVAYVGGVGVVAGGAAAHAPQQGGQPVGVAQAQHRGQDARRQRGQQRQRRPQSPVALAEVGIGRSLAADFISM